MVYDITDKQSFKDVQNWLDECDKFAKDNAIKILIGNKCDLAQDRQVSYEEGKNFADSLGMNFIETSAKEDSRVEVAFTDLTKQMKK